MTEKNNKKQRAGKLFLVSLGCPKNLVDTETVAGALLSAGMELVFSPEEATTYFINTCAFLQSARNEAEEAIAEGAEWKRSTPGGTLIVGGCLAVHDTLPEYQKRYPEVDRWVGPGELQTIAAQPECCPGVPVRLGLTLPHVAYLKIADGCDNRCAYCLIPKLRGPKKSRSIAAVRSEAELLVSNGVRELILIAQDTTAFGSRGETFAGLLKTLEEIPGNFKMRILYTHPAHYTDELIGFLAHSKKVLPYLDIPLQHISDHLLKAMHRTPGEAGIEALIAKLRAAIPQLVLRTTFITGFPGETEEDFQKLLDFTARVRFERLGVFPFSPEPGTAAAKLEQTVPADVASARATELMRRQHLRTARRNAGLIGQTVRVLIDEVTPDYAIARSYADAPEIDQVIQLVPSRQWRAGTFADVRITESLRGGDLLAEPVRKRK